MVDFRKIRALALDGDGTLWRGQEPLPGLREFGAFIGELTLPWVVLTNNSTRTPYDYARKLAGFGLNAPPERILTCGMATAAHLKRNFPNGTRIYVVGEAGLHQAIASAGYYIVPDAAVTATVVVAGGDSTLTYAKLKDATLHLQRGARFIGTNPDVISPAEEGLLPEAGTIIAALRAATGVEPIIIGKPERPLFDMAVEVLGTPADRCVMIGDRAETDIAGGQRAGMQTILIETGVDDAASAKAKGIKPDAAYASLPEMIAKWQAALRQ
jgi:4-nitrophenyl phosphatase